MSKTLQIRNLTIGQGCPKIIVPIVGVTKEEIIDTAKDIKVANPDIVEWRADWFKEVFDFEKVKVVLCELRATFGDTPILFTFRIIDAAHRFGVKVVASNHDFLSTPEKGDIVSRLKKMDSLGADIPKIAVMPACRADVITLLDATQEADEAIGKPIITISMSGTGLVSRLSGESFGSALTFGAVGKVSAPGQMNAEDLRLILELIHKSS